jgi:PAS domain S-box-containing protein
MSHIVRDSDISYRNLFETMTQGVVYHNAEGKIIAINAAAEKILGLTFEQMIGRTSMDPRWKAIHEDGSDFSGENHPSMIALKTGETVKDVIMGVFNPEEEAYRWISINAVPEFREGERKPYQVYVTVEDITERERAGEEIRVLAKFPSENPNPVLRVGKDGTILYGNKASNALLKMWKCHLGQRMSDDWCEFILNTLNAGVVQETEIEHADRVISLSFTPVSDAGYVNIYGQDITERKQAEEELRQQEKFEGVIEMAGGVCHELNQPMQIISGYSEIIMMGLEDDNPLYENIKSIKLQINRMRDITIKLMAITRYETTDYLKAKIIDIDKATK